MDGGPVPCYLSPEHRIRARRAKQIKETAQGTNVDDSKSAESESGAGRDGAHPGKKYASSVDVAKLAGVSQSAVSRTFTEGTSVSPKTRERVLKAAEELGYGPSLIPRIMLTHRSSLIAIVSGGLYNPFYANIVERFAQNIQLNGHTVVFFTVSHGEYIDEIIPHIMGYRVDGIISALSILSENAANRCAKMKLPVVLLNGKVGNNLVTSVCSDNVAGGREVALLMLRRGGKRFGYIAGKKGNMASEDRLAGFMGGLVEQGISGVKIRYGEFLFEGGYRSALELMGAKHAPDAIFCANDLMAIGAMEAIRKELGLRVPEDVMIAGFDDIQAAAWPSFELTTVRQDAPALVDKAMTLLNQMIDGGALQANSFHLVAAPLIERSSTRR